VGCSPGEGACHLQLKVPAGHDWVSVERYSDGALNITVTVQPPALGFYDAPTV